MKLTDEQKLKHVVETPHCCPFCDSPDISEDQIETDSIFVTIKKSCHCGGKWEDIYMISGIEVEEGEQE